ncbi:MAG: hypothetical protein KDD62_12450, partial [Bdellovibrionales bacterium]|nr:hypothetical protein [Bdellovibrionales bacterium]
MYFLLYHLEQLLNLDAATPKVALINSYLLNVWVSVLPATFGLFYFAFLVRRAGATERASVTLSFVLGFGTLYFPYSTQLWGHGSACAFLIMSVFFIVRQRSSDISLAAACMGFAVLMDFLAALPACLSLLLFHRTQRTEVMRYIVIGLAFAGVLLLYNRACFGAFFVMPTDHMNPAFVDHDGLMGMFRSFQGEALFGLTLSLRRGIFVMMPILIFSIYGFARGLLNRERDKLFWYALLVASSLLGVNVCFNGWHGGATVAARYQIIALPFWLLALARVNLQGFLFKVCTLISVANMLVIASFGVLCPDSHANPLYGAAYPFVVRALLHNHVSFGLPILPFGNLTPMPLPIRLQALDGSLPRYGNFTAWNWGELIGVSEGLSLALPIALVVVLL